jgi:cytochrome c peroxidase
LKTFRLYALAFAVLMGCESQVVSTDDRIAQLKLETLPAVVDPVNNQHSEAKAILGKALFFDPILSGEKDIACATCHSPSHGYADGIDLSIGVGGRGLAENRVDFSGGRIPIIGRNSPTIINTGFNGLIAFTEVYNPLTAPMFWDGRKKSLEEQSTGPITSFNEMRGDGYAAAVAYDSIIARLKKIDEYKSLFAVAFGSPDSIDEKTIGKAIAAFERTILSNSSPYDQFIKGDKSALTQRQKNGLLLFYGKANCAGCHSGPMLSDYNYYNLGIPYNPKRAETDKGVDNKFLFRTPSLRNVTLTAPYMHNGMFPTLESVIKHYARAQSQNPDISSVDPKVQPLHLTQDEVEEIVDFLNSLTDDGYDQEMLARVPSGLLPGGN